MKILHHVRIYTMDDQRTQADALAFDQGIIVALGRLEDLSARYPDAECIDGHGRTVLPSFIDPHIHFLLGAFFDTFLDCSHTKISDTPTLRTQLEKLAAATKPGQWLVGRGFDPLRHTGHPPTRQDLDRACPDHPVMIIHYACHECLVNSLALDKIGITPSTPQPRGGIICRDKNGLTGRLLETACGQAFSISVREFSDQNEDKLIESITTTQNHLFRRGITRIGDPAVSTREETLYEKAFKQGSLSLHVTGYPNDDNNFYGVPRTKAAEKRIEDTSKQLVKGPLKFFLDGADQAAVRLSVYEISTTALATLKNVVARRSFDPIRVALRSPSKPGLDLSIHLGVLMTQTKELESTVRQAVKNGHPIVFHALGNEAVEQALTVMNRIPYPHKIPARLEHAIFLRDKDINAIKKYPMSVVTQPYFLTHLGSDNLPPISGLKILPLRSMIDAGIHVAGSSDWPVVSCNPFRAIERSVTRVSIDNEYLQREEAITVYEALAMYTREAAYVLGQSEEAGSLEVGKQADFIILSTDPLTCNSYQLHTITIDETYLGGNCVYQKDTNP